MTIYNTQRLKELMFEQIKKDTKYDGDDIEITIEMFNKLFLLFHLAEESREKNTVFKDWKFYFIDDLAEKFIDNDRTLRQMESELGTEEALEEAKRNGDITGFMELDYDLYIIKE